MLTIIAPLNEKLHLTGTVQIFDPDKEYPAIVIRRALTIGSLVAIGSLALPFVTVTSAVAAEGHFRSSHGEPLNDSHVTPGATFNVSTATICRSGYASSVRYVPESAKNRVYAEYGILHHSTNQYEIDHLISLELGGSNSISNLWPELNDHPHGYLNSKDILENRLHALVCSGALSLSSAQRQISTDWVVTYHEYLGVWPSARTSTPLPTTRGPGTTAPSSPFVVRISIVFASVAPGGTETLTASSRKHQDSCNLVVILPSGRRSTANGLGTTPVDARGDATWTWRIGSRTGAGTAQATVTCGVGAAHGTFAVT
jgi:hypothetical protein